MKHLTLPLSEEDRLNLKVGEQVYLSGVLYTARDAAHQRMYENDFTSDEPLDTIYYVGPTQTPPGRIIGSAGPTTSTRMDKYSEFMVSKGTRVFIGKGRRDTKTKECFLKNHCVYLIAVGGLGALLSHCIVKNETLYFEDLQTEAIRRLEVKDFPCFVGIDCKGDDIYE